MTQIRYASTAREKLGLSRGEMSVVIRGTRRQVSFYVKSTGEHHHFISSILVMINTGGETFRIIVFTMM